jgi:8-hydroxy-5-deazaflavin:NADPH oxidoreductase
MNIAIIGSGNVGGALAQSLLEASHNVLIGSKLPLSEKSRRLAAVIGENRFVSAQDAALQSDVVIFCTPPEIVPAIITQLGDLTRKTIIDATNSFRNKPDPFQTAFAAIKALGKTEKVIKCFNTTGFENLRNLRCHGQGIDMFVAGDDKASKEVAIQLATDIGFANCYDFGGDDKVELLEQFALCWINLAIMQGHGRNLAFQVVKRKI